ncbi:MAG: hypothetical protein AAFY22_05915 [Pseudomonadota bacterium]
MTVTLREHAARGGLEVRVFCMNWPVYTGCGFSWTAPTARFDLDATLLQLEAAMVCPACRNDRVQVILSTPPAHGAPHAFPGRH